MAKAKYLKENRKKLLDFCHKHSYEIQEINEYQYRVFGATHIIDIWPSRMKYHRIGGETINSDELYFKLNSIFNENEVEQLLSTGGLNNEKVNINPKN